MGKGEIARYEQFLLFPRCFQKTFLTDTYQTWLAWERVNQFIYFRGIIKILTLRAPNKTHGVLSPWKCDPNIWRFMVATCTV